MSDYKREADEDDKDRLTQQENIRAGGWYKDSSGRWHQAPGSQTAFVAPNPPPEKKFGGEGRRLGDDSTVHREDTGLLAGESSVKSPMSSAQQPILSTYQPDHECALGTVVYEYECPPNGGCCWYCTSNSRADELFKPCQCSSFIHRDCFRKWRAGWINPRNYFNCPNCMYSYKMERVKESTTASKEDITRQYRFKLIKLWLGTLFMFGAFIAAIAFIAYFADNSEKNIPVGVKYMMSSVVSGFPKGNSTAEWRENFKKPDVYVWPYYTLLGLFVTAILVLIGFCAIGCTFNEKERRKRNCCADCCRGNGNSDVGLWYCYCYDPCPHVNCNTDCVGGCKGCAGGGGGGGCKMDGDAAQFLVILLVIIIVVIILSAIVVVILYAIQKWSLLYDRMTHMLLTQQEELEGETTVLAINESWRPLSAV